MIQKYFFYRNIHKIRMKTTANNITHDWYDLQILQR